MLELTLKRKQPIAVQFRRWVIEDVVPSIMAIGSYTVPQAMETIRPTLAIANGPTIKYMSPGTLSISPVISVNEIARKGAINNETDLHYEVVRFMRSRFPRVVANLGLGENQDTSDKRVDSSRKGYQRGVPDLIYPYVTARYSGIAIELKHPGGRGELAET